MTEQSQPAESSNATTNMSGGVNAEAEHINIGADVVGRDKIIHIEHYHANGETGPGKFKIYHNLPQPDYDQFIGREQELKRVHELLSPTNRHFVITIDGIGGIGKSALALEVAHHYLRHFERLTPEERFEAIIWASAKQTILTVDGIVHRRQALRTLDDIYTTIAVALRREDITRARLEEQSEVVRNALAQQRTLLIIDNLETVDDEAVLEFLRELPAPTKAIVTTRHRIDVAYPIRLVGMPWSDAQGLIEQECKKKDVTLQPIDAQRLYDRTGGVPLALVWSIAQMGIGYGVELVLQRLGQPTNDIARFCFESAVKSIANRPAHQLLMALSLFATDASREALGYITKQPVLDRDEGLVTLERLSLVNKQSDRFQALPLTLRYSQAELARDLEQERLYRERWIEFLLEWWSAQKSGRPLTFEIAKLEVENSLAAMDWCWRTDHLRELGLFIELLDLHLSRVGNLTSLVKFLRLAIEGSLILGDELLQARASRRLANFLELQDELDEAQQLIDRAIEIDRLHNDTEELIRALYNRSVIQWKQHADEAARLSAHEAIDLAQQAGYPRQVIRTLCQLARVDLDAGAYESAEVHLQRALALREQVDASEGDDWRAAMLYRLLGQLAFAKQEYATASQYYQHSLDIAHKTNALTMQVRALICIAELHLRQGDVTRARRAAEEVLDLSAKLGMKRETTTAQAYLENLGKSTS